MDIEMVERSFNCGEQASLLLSNIRGKVSIQAGDDHLISIRAEKILDSGDADNTVIELSQDDDGKVIASTHYDPYGFRFFRRSMACRVNYDILVPSNCDLKIRGVSNIARIDGISGEMDISTVSGDLGLYSLTGELKIKSVSGNVQAERISAPARIDTVSGDLHFKMSNIPSLQAKTVSGDLTLETRLGNGPYDFNAVSGDIRVEVSRVMGLTVDSSSLSGELICSIPQCSSNSSRNHQRVEILGGGVEIRHKSVSGDFCLASTGEIDEPVELPSPVSDQVVKVAHSEILASIERGELSVDEALSIIEKAD